MTKHMDFMGDILIMLLIIMLVFTAALLPTIAAWNYYLETRCINSHNIKSEECFELFIRTGKNVNHNIQTWEK